MTISGTPPHVVILYCTQCNWLLRSGWMAQELLSTFGTAQDVTTDELRIESFFPADEASAALLKMMAAG